jgi:UDP-N-acetylglucosamine acyltransferase
MIHSTAIIDSKAEIDSEVDIGAYVVIEGGVKIGQGTKVLSHVVITGSVSIGKNNKIGHGSIIGGYPQDLSFDPTSDTHVTIGDDNMIREHCTIHRGTKPGSATVVGTGNLLMAGTHLGHNVSLGNQLIVANNVLLGGYASVGDRAFLGGGSVVHQFTKIGEMAILQGTTAVSKDVPPFAAAAGRNSVVGMNVVGMRRSGFDALLRQEAKEAFTLLYHSGLNRSQAIAESQKKTWSPQVCRFWEFVKNSKRGICGFARWSEVKREMKADSAG